MHKYLTSARYISKYKQTFQVENLLPVQNRICTKMCFSLLEKIVRNQRETLDQYASEDVSEMVEAIGCTERSILRYICGASIHNVTSKFQESARNNLVGQSHEAKVEYRCTKLLQLLCISEGFAIANTEDPESLKEILHRQYKDKGLTIVSDDCFKFFKVVYCKLKKMQTFKHLARNTKHLLGVTEMHLKNDIQVIELWINLFSQAKESCTCEEDNFDNCEDYIDEDAQNIHLT